MNIIVEICRQSKNWSNHRKINSKLIKKVTRNIINRFKGLRNVQNIELSILLSDDDEMMKLNIQFRNKHKPTNVLSFPDVDINPEELNNSIWPSYLYLGDIAFGYNIICTEAKDYNKTVENHFIHLLTHSILHLLGYDHQDRTSAQKMESLEIDILQDFAIASPY